MNWLYNGTNLIEVQYKAVRVNPTIKVRVANENLLFLDAKETPL